MLPRVGNIHRIDPVEVSEYKLLSFDPKNKNPSPSRIAEDKIGPPVTNVQIRDPRLVSAYILLS
jgi:hypothetical protein